MSIVVWTSAALIVLGVSGALAYRPLRRMLREIEVERARELFRLQRERLEAKFIELASSTGKPKGLRWEHCEFHSPVSFVRDRSSRQLSAFIEVTIRFSAIEGEGMEEVAAVNDLRNATAVFHYHHGHWGTGGRVLFNMNPEEAIHRYQEQFEPIPIA
ncbi:hypothetical protein Pan216_50720 [Planctomycetes bacterium Pan216]|uniref:Uncharacterized protein n=1 Tax=Kolteria novifilia TaxID=2527975 RepID=A0A518BBC8_9BACT|nr:hypothetical protein Pan216_50720 [Planctomycetes bacterium Pan216]